MKSDCNYNVMKITDFLLDLQISIPLFPYLKKKFMLVKRSTKMMSVILRIDFLE